MKAFKTIALIVICVFIAPIGLAKLDWRPHQNSESIASDWPHPEIKNPTNENPNWAAKREETSLTLIDTNTLVSETPVMVPIAIFQGVLGGVLHLVMTPVLIDYDTFSMPISGYTYMAMLVSIVGIGYLLSYADTKKLETIMSNK